MESNVPPLNSLALPSTPLSKLQKQFLRFSVGNLTALLPVLQLAEVLTMTTDQIVPIPHMPPWVRGIYNWRGEILWMVDLRQSLGLPSWHQQTPLQTNVPSSALETVIAIQARQSGSPNRRSQVLGLVVDRVEDIEWCQTDLIQPLPAPPEVPFLQGYWTKPTGERLAVFDGEAIIAAMAQAG